MRNLTLPLAATTLIFAGSTLYFAMEAQRAQDAATLPDVIADEVPPAGFPAQSTTATQPIAHVDQPATSSSEAESRQAMNNTAMRAYAESQVPRWRRILENPRLLEKRRREIAQNHKQLYAELRDYVALTDDEYRRYVDLLTELEMSSMVSQYQCAIDESCDVQAASEGARNERVRQVSALLGEERRQQVDNYMDNMQERSTAAYLRDMLPDTHPLSDSRARELVEALGAERRRFVQELLQSGAEPAAFYAAGSGATFSGSARSVEDKVLAVQDYQRRMRDRASHILEPAQLDAFEAMQAEALAAIRAQWEAEPQSTAAR